LERARTTGNFQPETSDLSLASVKSDSSRASDSSDGDESNRNGARRNKKLKTNSY